MLSSRGPANEAIRALKKSVELEPRNGEGWLSLSRAAERGSDFSNHSQAGLRAVTLMPENHQAHFATGVALSRLQRHEEAEAIKSSLMLRPDWGDAWDNLGLTYQFLNRLDEAEAAFGKGSASPDKPYRRSGAPHRRPVDHRHWHLAQLELMQGEYARGFAGAVVAVSARDVLDKWIMRSLTGTARIFAAKLFWLWTKKAAAMESMMCRYLPLLRARGVYVKFLIRPVFASLFKRLERLRRRSSRMMNRRGPSTCTLGYSICPIV